MREGGKASLVKFIPPSQDRILGRVLEFNAIHVAVEVSFHTLEITLTITLQLFTVVETLKTATVKGDQESGMSFAVQ